MTRTRNLSLFRAIGLALAVLLISGCHLLRPEVIASPTPDAVVNVPKATKRLLPSTMPLVTTPGTWLSPPEGPMFQPMDTLDPRHAMVYIYRPHTNWEDLEVQAPSFFIDGKKVFGLKSGSYTWMELHPGEYKFYAKRPLLVLFIKKIFELDMKIEGGRTYFLRYSEDAPFYYAAEGLLSTDFQHAGYLQEVPERIAMQEIAQLKLDHPGLYFAGGGRVDHPRWAPFETFPETGTDPAAPAAAADAARAASAPGGFWSRTRSLFRQD